MPRYAVVNKIQEVFVGRSPSFNSKAQKLRSSDIVRNTVPTTGILIEVLKLPTYSLLIKENADLNTLIT